MIQIDYAHYKKNYAIRYGLFLALNSFKCGIQIFINIYLLGSILWHNAKEMEHSSNI